MTVDVAYETKGELVLIRWVRENEVRTVILRRVWLGLARSESNLIALFQYSEPPSTNLVTVDLGHDRVSGQRRCTRTKRLTKVPLLDISEIVTVERLSSTPSQVMTQCLLPASYGTQCQRRVVGGRGSSPRWKQKPLYSLIFIPGKTKSFPTDLPAFLPIWYDFLVLRKSIRVREGLHGRR